MDRKPYRINLREFTLQDALTLNVIRNDPRVMELLNKKGSEPLDKTMELIRKMHLSDRTNGTINMAIELLDKNLLIGYIGLWKIDWESSVAEIGYLLHADYWNQGLVSEAMDEFLELVKEKPGVNSILAEVLETNVYSLRLLEKRGFVRSADARNVGYVILKKEMG